ncbi:MAG: hypothetical protein JOZ52_14620 [Acidobacteria bacterium]|nr:hypothetical protein [Acidobacteriota bacterium]
MPVSAQDDAGEDQYMVTNVAAAANGGTAIASSTYSTGYPASAAINGDRKGVGWGAGTGGWNDATLNSFPDSLEIQFNGLMSIGEIDIVTLQDNFTNPVEPTLAMTFNNYGIRDFRIWYRGSDGLWYLLLNVAGNNKVLRSFTFSPVATDRIKVEVLNSPSYSRIVEVEAWGRSAYSVITEPVETPPSPNPTPTPCGNSGKMDPCELSRDLLSAMQGNRTGPLPYGRSDSGAQFPRPQNWTSQLDWNYNSWRNNGSQNKPVLAHALTLWRAPAEYGKTTDNDALVWWVNYLGCQTRSGSGTLKCDVANPGSLQYWKGAELFSNTYDSETTSGIIATHVWAAREYPTIPNTPANADRRNKVGLVLDRARLYLQLNWRLYALAAGKGPATRQLNRFNYSDGPNPFNDPSQQGCHNRYDGPFIPLAGMRSTPQHTCTDDRGPLLARALGWSHNGPKGTDHVKDLLVQAEAINATKTIYTTESAYAIAIGVRAMLRRHIDGRPNAGEDTTAIILSALDNVRTGVNYYFVGARINGVLGNEARLTLMTDNMTQETAPIFAITYDYTQKLARILFPWTNRPAASGCFTTYPLKPWRAMETLGWAEFRPFETAPTSVFASSSNRDGFSHCKNQENGVPVEETFMIPSNWQWQYEIKFSPSGPPMKIR